MDTEAAVESILAPAEDPKKRAPEATSEVTESEHDSPDATETEAQADEHEAEDLSDADVDTPEDDESEEGEEAEDEEEGEKNGEESDTDEDDAEDDEELDADEEEEDDEVVYTTADGDEVTLNELKRGFLREKDYTQKTQELSALRQQVAEERKGVEQHNNVLAEHLNLALNVIEPTLAQYASVDWTALQAADPYEYAEHQAKYQQAQAQYAQVAQAAAASVEQHKAAREAHMAQVKAQETEALKLALPDLADPKKGRTLAHSIREYALQEVGLSPEEAGNLVDHRLILVLNKARKYDEISKSKLTVGKKKRSRGPKRTIKAGSPQSAGDRKNKAIQAKREAVRRSGSADAAVDWLLT